MASDRSAKITGWVADLERVRRDLLELAPLIHELRQAILDHLAAKRLRLGEYATYLSVPRASILPLFEGKGVLCAGRAFECIIKNLKLDKLGARIAGLGQALKTDTRRGMAIYSGPVINLAIDLEVAALRLDLLPTDFAGLFGADEATVCGVLKQAKSDLQALCQADVFAAVRSTLDARDFSAWASAYKQGVRDRRQAKGETLERHVVALLNQKAAKSRDEAAKLLGVNRSTLGHAVKGEGGEETLDKLLKRASELIKLPGNDAVTPVSPIPLAKPAAAAAVASPAPVSLPKSTAAATLLQNIDQAAAGVSPLGVRCVLTTEAWQTVSGRLEEDYLQQLVRAFEVLRALLALQIQHDDAKTRDALQHDRTVGHQIDELLLQLKLWTAKHPTALLGTHDRQRQSLVRLEDERGGH